MAIESLYLKPTIGRIYIVVGILCMLIFVLGAIVLKDSIKLLFVASSSILVVMGFSSLKKPSATYSNTEFIINNPFGKPKITYTYPSKTAVVVKNNKLYLNSKKMKISAFLMKESEWRRMVQFFSEGDDLFILDELQES